MKKYVLKLKQSLNAARIQNLSYYDGLILFFGAVILGIIGGMIELLICMFILIFLLVFQYVRDKK